jgi:hypothetical protein
VEDPIIGIIFTKDQTREDATMENLRKGTTTTGDLSKVGMIKRRKKRIVTMMHYVGREKCIMIFIISS